LTYSSACNKMICKNGYIWQIWARKYGQDKSNERLLCHFCGRENMD
jgi:hypothetical protein